LLVVPTALSSRSKNPERLIATEGAKVRSRSWPSRQQP
jgi:hypothetical protein